MLPSIALVTAVERLRDGGSLCAAFQGSDANEYWLLLRVRLADSNSLRPIGFESPLVSNLHTGLAQPISWEQADALIGQIKRLIHNEEWTLILEKMVRVVQTAGSLDEESDA